MAYTRTYWVDKDDDKGVAGTPVDAEHMNNIEDGIQENSDAIEAVNADLTDNYRFKMYSLPSQIDDSLSASSTIPEIIDKMSNYSILICRAADLDLSAMNNGSLIASLVIVRVGNSRYFCLGFRGYASVTDEQSRMFFATYDGTDMHGWFELAKADTNTTSVLNAEAEKMGDI